MLTLLRNKSELARWLPLAIVALAALLRLIGLGEPQSLVFDETYYVKDAFSLLKNGVELQWATDSDANFIKGLTSGLTGEPSFVVHPPLGKWLIALGLLVFGPGNPFGWRIVVALLGVATIWLSMACAKKMFESQLWGNLVGFFMAIDGVAIVLSRTALLDQILGFFVILGFYFLLKDLETTGHSYRWIILMAVSLGLATAVKWSGLYFLFVFVLYKLLVSGKRNFDTHRKLERESETKLEKSLWLKPTFFESIKVGSLTVIVALSVYVSSYLGWFLSRSGWDRNHDNDTFLFGIPAALKSLWFYHTEIYNFHANLHADHPYASNPLTWPLMLRPTSFFWDERNSGCLFEAPKQLCVSAVTALGNPLIWWGAFIASSILIGSWFRTRDKQTTLIFLGIIAGFVPWLLLMGRTVFEFYVIAFEPWIIFILVFGLKSWWDNSANRARAKTLISSFVALVFLVSVFFLPIWTGMWISYDYWRIHMWLPSWI